MIVDLQGEKQTVMHVMSEERLAVPSIHLVAQFHSPAAVHGPLCGVILPYLLISLDKIRSVVIDVPQFENARGCQNRLWDTEISARVQYHMCVGKSYSSLRIWPEGPKPQA